MAQHHLNILDAFRTDSTMNDLDSPGGTVEAKTDEASEMTISIGQHKAQFIAPGFIRIEWNGLCTRDDFARVLEWADNRVPRKPYVLLANLARLETVTPEAREFSAKDPRYAHIKRIAFIGASFHQRVAATMVSRAIAWFYKERRGQLSFFDTEAEALVWLRQEYALIHPGI